MSRILKKNNNNKSIMNAINVNKNILTRFTRP